MRFKLFPQLAACLCLALAGCSSTSTKVDTGAIRAATFSFVNTGSKPSPAYTDNRQDVHPIIQEAITKNLGGRGLSKAAAGGDVTVGYLIIVGNNVSTVAIDQYFGYNENSGALHDKAHRAYINNKNPNYFEAGTLVIDIVDSKTFKLLKRGYATRQTLRNLPLEARAARIQEVVDEILRDLRINP